MPQNQIAQSQNPEEKVGSFFGWGSHTTPHHATSSYGYGRPSQGYGYNNHYGSNYGSNYGNRGYGYNKRPLNNHIYVKGPVFGSGSLRSSAGGEGSVGSIQGGGEAADPVHHHHHAAMAGSQFNHLHDPAFRVPEINPLHLSRQHHAQPLHLTHPQHALQQAPQSAVHPSLIQHTQHDLQQHEVPQHQIDHNIISSHLRSDSAARQHQHPGLANYRQSERSYPQSSSDVKCGQNILVGCQPTVQEVPCLSEPKY